MAIHSHEEFNDYEDDGTSFEEELELDFDQAYSRHSRSRRRRGASAWRVREDMAERRRLKRNLYDWDDYDREVLEDDAGWDDDFR